MSSGRMCKPHDPALYRWSGDLDEADYLQAVYEITSTCAGPEAALSMAMEQSVGTSRIHDYLDADALAPSAIRVRHVRQLPQQCDSVVPPYHLQTPVYGDTAHDPASFEVTLSIPLRLLASRPAQLWNILVGELPRLGILTRFRLVDARLPVQFGPGPGFGVAGIRALARQATGPLLCRSMRPAVGLDTATMAKLNRDVLIGGFHIVKDDELQVFAHFHEFEQHLRAMLAARDLARQHTGEAKLYFANLICEPWELQERWALCCALGVDGVLVAPWIQGLGTLSYLARQRRMPILAHNTLGELFSRHPDWRIDELVVCHWLRALGADLFVTSGDFGADPTAVAHCHLQLEPVRDVYGEHAAMLPILQGGKNPDELPLYRKAIGSDDFMLIVASWVDQYGDGLIEGAKAFRRALTEDAVTHMRTGAAGKR